MLCLSIYLQKYLKKKKKSIKMKNIRSYRHDEHVALKVTRNNDRELIEAANREIDILNRIKNSKSPNKGKK